MKWKLPLPKFARLALLRWRSTNFAISIDEAAAQREQYIVAAGKLNDWIAEAQKAKAKIDAKIDALDSSKNVIANAIERRA